MSGLTTALAGCPPDAPQPQPPSSSTPVASVEPVGSTKPEPRPLPKPAPYTMPSLEVPAGLNAIATENFKNLVNEVKALHGELDAADKASEKLCDIDDATCAQAWSDVASHLAKAKDMQDDLAPRCRGESNDAKLFYARLDEHVKVIEQRRASIQKRIDAALDDQAARDRWQKMAEDAAIPKPCLKYGCEDW